MQTSLARRQRYRRNGAARRPRGRSAAKPLLFAIPLVLFLTLLAVGLVAFVSVVTAYAYYSRDLDDPKVLLSNLRFDQQTVVYDRSGEVELARLGELRRELVTFEQLPAELIDATTAIEDKDFWSNPGFDFGAFVDASLDTLNGRPRGASTITQQLVRARLLPQEAFEDSIYERKVREIIQSVRLTQEFQGEEGKQQIITAYLNQNFYGNHSYGVKAAAKSYFAKELEDLTLAEMAVLAAIPQSPTAYDLVRNAEPTCEVEIEPDAECPADKMRLVVPATTEIVKRRNTVLEFMKTRSVLSADNHTAAEYQRAKAEPVVLVDQGSRPWRAPHFVWQVREQLAEILCGTDDADDCEAVDTGGYRVTTTLDWKMQQTAEKWVYVSSRVPNAKNPQSLLEARKIPRAEWSWILGLRGHNVHNAAAAVLDYRSGDVLAYVGSGSYTASGNKKFQPQFDVLSDGWRQPGSAIKPVNYAIGIDDKTMTASTVFMDVVTNFAPQGRKAFTPTQADGYERGPVRLRGALQFSLNIPSIKAGIINGLDHFFEKSKDFGLAYPSTAIPVTSMGIGTLEIRPMDLLAAYGTIANGGVRMPRETIIQVTDDKGTPIWPIRESERTGDPVISPEAAYIVTDILAGNTDTRINPYWGKWALTDGKTRRPAAYKTGTTSDNRDVHAYGYLPAPKDADEPALAVGVWMGNSDNSPNDGKLSLDTSAPVWSAILGEISKGMPMAKFTDSRPDGIVTAEVDAHSGLLPGPFTTRTVKEIFIKGTVPKQRDNIRRAVDVDAATGLRWKDGCAGPRVTRGFLDFSKLEEGFPTWQRASAAWATRAARGVLVRGGPEKTATMTFYNRSFAPFGPGWGGAFLPRGECTPPPPPVCVPRPIIVFPPWVEPTPPPGTTFCVTPTPPPSGGPGNGNPGNGNPGGPDPTRPPE